MRRMLVLAALCLLAGCVDDTRGDGDDEGEAGDGPGDGDGPEPGADPTDDGADDPPPAAEENETPEPRGAVTWTIRIAGNDFVDGSITVQKGDTVTWRQEDNVPHTATSDDGTTFDSGTLTLANPSFSHTFDTVGDIAYYCEVHPSMVDSINVLETYAGVP